MYTYNVCTCYFTPSLDASPNGGVTSRPARCVRERRRPPPQPSWALLRSQGRAPGGTAIC